MFHSMFYAAWNRIKRLLSGAQVQTLESKPERVHIEVFGSTAYFGMNSHDENPSWQGTVPAIILAKVVFKKDGSADLHIASQNQDLDQRNEIMHDYLGYVFRQEISVAFDNGMHISGEMYFLNRVEP